MDRRSFLNFGIGAATLMAVTSVEAAPVRNVKFPASNLDWLSKTVDFINSPYRGRVVIATTDGCFIEGPKVECKEFPKETEVKMTSDEFEVPFDINMQAFYVVDKHGNVVAGQVSGMQLKKCQKVTFVTSIHLPPNPFVKPECNCGPKTEPTPKLVPVPEIGSPTPL